MKTKAIFKLSMNKRILTGGTKPYRSEAAETPFSVLIVEIFSLKGGVERRSSPLHFAYL